MSTDTLRDRFVRVTTDLLDTDPRVALTLAAIGHARESGFARLRLDTLGHMKAARALYADLGFVDIPPYHDDAAPGMSFMELAL